MLKSDQVLQHSAGSPGRDTPGPQGLLQCPLELGPKRTQGGPGLADAPRRLVSLKRQSQGGRMAQQCSPRPPTSLVQPTKRTAHSLTVGCARCTYRLVGRHSTHSLLRCECTQTDTLQLTDTTYSTCQLGAAGTQSSARTNSVRSEHIQTLRLRLFRACTHNIPQPPGQVHRNLYIRYTPALTTCQENPSAPPARCTHT